MNTNILNELQNKLGELPKAQRKVADYILTHSQSAGYMTIDQLAKEVQTSTTTIMRLAYTMGFSGYSDFSKNLLTNQKILNEEFLRNRQTASPDTLIANCADRCIDNICRTADLLNPETLEKAVTMIKNARHIYLLGAKSSFAAATDLYHLLSCLRDGCDLIGLNTGDLPERGAWITSEDLVIGISMSRYHSPVTSFFRLVKQRHAQTIAITDSYDVPFYDTADLIIPCCNKSLSFHNSLSGTVLVIDYLVTAYANQDYQQTSQTLKAFDDFLENWTWDHYPK